MSLKILTLSYLFPNRAQPNYGIFVLNRIKALKAFSKTIVIAPIQWYPMIRRLRNCLWGSDIPSKEIIEDLEIYHPRFAIIPRYFKWIDAITYLLAVQSVVKTFNKNGDFDFDLIDLHWTYPDIVAGYYLARKYRKKYIVTIRGHEALYLDENSLRRRILTYFLHRADFVITLSDELRRITINLGVDPNKIRVVLNGVDLSLFKPMDKAACRSLIGLPPDKKIILSVGRLTEGKGHHDLIRMMPALLKFHDTELYIVGGVNPEDDFGSTLKSLRQDLGLINVVHFIEKLDHRMLPRWYNAADIFCLATKREGCPNVILEALACGTPAVVTDVGATKVLIKDAENGFLIPPGEINSLGNIVINSLNTDWNREKIAKEIVSRGWSSCAQELIDIYHSVIENQIKD